MIQKLPDNNAFDKKRDYTLEETMAFLWVKVDEISEVVNLLTKASIDRGLIKPKCTKCDHKWAEKRPPDSDLVYRPFMKCSICGCDKETR